MEILTLSEWQARTYTQNINDETRINKAIQAATNNLNIQCNGNIFKKVNEGYFKDKNNADKLNYLLTALSLATDYYIESGGLFVNINTSVNSTAGNQSVNGDAKNAQILQLRKDILGALSLAGVYSSFSIGTPKPTTKPSGDIAAYRDTLWTLLFDDGQTSKDYSWSSERITQEVENLTNKYSQAIYNNTVNIDKLVNENKTLLNEFNQLVQANKAINTKLDQNNALIIANEQGIALTKQSIIDIQNSLNSYASKSDINHLNETTENIKTDLNATKNQVNTNGAAIQQTSTKTDKNANDIKQLQAALLGANVVLYVGPYNSNKSYEVAQTVSYNDNWYICKQSAPAGYYPDDTNYWLEIQQPTLSLDDYYTKSEADARYLTQYDLFSNNNRWFGEQSFTSAPSFENNANLNGVLNWNNSTLNVSGSNLTINQKPVLNEDFVLQANTFPAVQNFVNGLKINNQMLNVDAHDHIVFNNQQLLTQNDINTLISNIQSNTNKINTVNASVSNLDASLRKCLKLTDNNATFDAVNKTISNVKDALSDTDAVNKRQLKSFTYSKNEIDDKIAESGGGGEYKNKVQLTYVFSQGYVQQSSDPHFPFYMQNGYIITDLINYGAAFFKNKKFKISIEPKRGVYIPNGSQSQREMGPYFFAASFQPTWNPQTKAAMLTANISVISYNESVNTWPKYYDVFCYWN